MDFPLDPLSTLLSTPNPRTILLWIQFFINDGKQKWEQGITLWKSSTLSKILYRTPIK